MTKYIQKPREVDAVQWFPGVEIEGVHITPGEQGVDYGSGLNVGMASIKTINGREQVKTGDWIITNETGEKEVCRANRFAQSYEPMFEPIPSV